MKQTNILSSTAISTFLIFAPLCGMDQSTFNNPLSHSIMNFNAENSLAGAQDNLYIINENLINNKIVLLNQLDLLNNRQPNPTVKKNITTQFDNFIAIIKEKDTSINPKKSYRLAILEEMKNSVNTSTDKFTSDTINTWKKNINNIYTVTNNNLNCIALEQPLLSSRLQLQELNNADKETNIMKEEDVFWATYLDINFPSRRFRSYSSKPK